jgi:nucleoside-diphosphate-sugar epimerase
LKKKQIFLTGAGGTMGNAALKELLKPERSAKHDIVILDLPSERSLKRLKPFENTPGLEIVWGDLTNYDDVLKCVSGADYVLHAAALISPAADHNPGAGLESKSRLGREHPEGYQSPARPKRGQAGHDWHGCGDR